MIRDHFSVDLTSESGRLDYAQQLYRRYLDDLLHDAAKAKVRLISGMQIAMRESQQAGYIEPLIFHKPTDDK